MPRKWIFPLFAALMALAAGCTGRGAAEATPDLQGTAAAMAKTMAADQLTQIGEQSQTSTPKASQSPTPTATEGLAFQITQAAADFQSSDVCLEASLADETVPDDTVLDPGESFEKTWTLTNTGNCPWSEDFSLVFDRGNPMGAPERTPLSGYVAPGQSVVLSLTMTAPGTPGSHIGFWELESQDGTNFGVGVNGGIPFWVRIVIPGPTPTPQFRDLAAGSGGSLRSDGDVTSGSLLAGDNASALGLQAFGTYNLGNLPPDANVLAVLLDLDEGYILNDDPFGDLGCLNVYADAYGTLDAGDYVDGSPAGALWRFCSQSDLSAGALRTGGEAAVEYVQTALVNGVVQFRFQFDNETDGDGTPDTIALNPLLRIEWNKPE